MVSPHHAGEGYPTTCHTTCIIIYEVFLLILERLGPLKEEETDVQKRRVSVVRFSSEKNPKKPVSIYFLFFLNIYILLKDSRLTTFQAHKVIQLYIYTYIIFQIFSIMGYYKMLTTVPFVIVPSNLCCLFHIYFIFELETRHPSHIFSIVFMFVLTSS